MNRKIVAGLGALCLAATLVGSSPATDTAAATDPCARTYGPNLVPVGITPTVVRFDVPVVDEEGCEQYQKEWNLRLNRWDVDVTDQFDRATFDPDYLPNTDTKPVSADLRFFTEGHPDRQEILPYSFRLAHLTTWGTTVKARRLDATHVRLSGTLVRADWEKGKFLPHPARKITIIKTGAKTRTVATPKLDAKGHFEITVKAVPGPNSWSIVYAGNSTSSPAEAGAQVK